MNAILLITVVNMDGYKWTHYLFLLLSSLYKQVKILNTITYQSFHFFPTLFSLVENVSLTWHFSKVSSYILVLHLSFESSNLNHGFSGIHVLFYPTFKHVSFKLKCNKFQQFTNNVFDIPIMNWRLFTFKKITKFLFRHRRKMLRSIFNDSYLFPWVPLAAALFVPVFLVCDGFNLWFVGVAREVFWVRGRFNVEPPPDGVALWLGIGDLEPTTLGWVVVGFNEFKVERGMLPWDKRPVYFCKEKRKCIKWAVQSDRHFTWWGWFTIVSYLHKYLGKFQGQTLSILFKNSRRIITNIIDQCFFKSRLHIYNEIIKERYNNFKKCQKILYLKLYHPQTYSVRQS